MAVRSFMSIMEAHEKAKSHGQTIFQSRQHAPKQPSFNQRAPLVLSSITHPKVIADIADTMVDLGMLTPNQRYNIAMQGDIS